MANDDFYGKLAEILEVEAVADGDVLEKFDAWDSLTKLSIIAMADSDYRVRLTAKELDAFGTVGGLRAHLEQTGK